MHRRSFIKFIFQTTHMQNSLSPQVSTSIGNEIVAIWSKQERNLPGVWWWWVTKDFCLKRESLFQFQLSFSRLKMISFSFNLITLISKKCIIVWACKTIIYYKFNFITKTKIWLLLFFGSKNIYFINKLYHINLHLLWGEWRTKINKIDIRKSPQIG